MKKKKQKVLKVRLPMTAVDTLHHRGGAHGSAKGQRGYDRAKEKAKREEEQSGPNYPLFFHPIIKITNIK
jgi:hypothetical protein